MKKIRPILWALLIGSTAHAAEVNCSAANEYCMDEFLRAADGKKSVEDAVGELPVYIRRNFTLKRGNNIAKDPVGIFGPHGHRVSKSESGSSAPLQPRVFAWDEKTGFVASWNSGNPDHTAAERVDLYDFDFKTNTHRLKAWGPQTGVVDANYVESHNGMACVACHGAVQRPIFPMYPDWPQFYGEFNDEMAGYAAGANALRTDLRRMGNEFQPKERELYLKFLQGEARSNPRYRHLYEVKPPRVATEKTENAYYPFRPRTTTSPFSDISRAFYYRPNLRIGVMLNRLTALQAFERITHSPLYQKYPDVMLYSLLDCNWDAEDTPAAGQEVRKRILGQVLDEARKQPDLAALNLRGAQFPDGRFLNTDPFDEGYAQIPYEDLLQLLGLKIEDIDIRFAHNSSFKVDAGYGVYDPRAFYHTDNAMDIGYIKDTYKMNPICDNDGSRCNFSYQGTYMQGLRYFNSYFDGSATMNELLAARMLSHLTTGGNAGKDGPGIQAVRASLRASVGNPATYFETLAKKYSHFSARLALDGEFFRKMDEIGPWIQLPFSPDMLNIQNRESFWSDGATPIRRRHAQWLTPQDRAAHRKNLNGGQNLCWKVYDVMKARLARP